MKTLLVISGGIEAVDAAKRALEMGLHVVVSDIDPEAPGFAYAHDRLIANVYSPEATADVAEDYNRTVRRIDGVICVAADAPRTAARVADRLGLPSISQATAHLACDKLAMKDRFKECGVPIPWFASVSGISELEAIVAERGQNLVIKPNESRGSRGVQRLAAATNLETAFDFTRSYSRTRRIMAEAYLDGPQVSTESIVIDGKCHTPGFFDRNYGHLEEYAPFFIEKGGSAPSRLSEAVQADVKDVVARAAAALGVTNGTVKGDIVVHNGAPYIIEMAARLSGGFFCTKIIPLNTGVDFVGCAIKLALGEYIAPSELEPRYQHHAVQRYVFPNPGHVVFARGAEAARGVPGVTDVVITAKPGDIIPPPGDKRPSAAMVLATGENRQAALSSAVAAISLIEVETI